MDLIKVINPANDEIIDEQRTNSFKAFEEIYNKYPDKIIVIGDEKHLNDVASLNRAHNNIKRDFNQILENNPSITSNYYFSILREDATTNPHDFLSIAFIHLDDYHNGTAQSIKQKVFSESSDSENVHILSNLVDDNDFNFIYYDRGLFFRTTYKGHKKENEIYDELLGMGFSYHREFDKIMNE